MDELTKYLMYNITPRSRHSLDSGIPIFWHQEGNVVKVDKRELLLSPDLRRKSEVTSKRAGAAAEAAERIKSNKYAHAIGSNYIFHGFGVETLGPSGPSAHALFRELSRRIVTTSGDPKAGSFLAQRISIEIQRGNAVSILERILYPRNKIGSKPGVVGGTPITEQQAIDLRITAFGSASCPPRGEWVRTPLIMRSPNQPLGFGLAAPRNGARSLLSALQAHVIKWLLFDSRPVTKDNKSSEPPDTYLKPSEERQEEALWRACSEVIWRCGGGFNTPVGVDAVATVALPTDNVYAQHSSHYYQDGVTETFQTEEGSGALLLLYSVILSRGCENVKKDLDGKLSYLVSSHIEGSLNIVTLLLTGRATPYLHNGVVYVGDEDHYAMPQFGILSRSPVGLLVWYGSEDIKNSANKQYPGSRLKTPAMPVWVTCCAGHYGVLFNTNRELLRNYHAERRFDINYYTCGGCHVLLSVDTRAQEDSAQSRSDDISATPLEKLIHTKWQDAKITWNGPTPYVGDTPK